MYRRHSMFPANDKKQYYIGSFISKLSESDSKQKYFTKSELIEIHSFLRKEISKNNWLYKLIQSIVDNGEILDEDTFEILKKIDSTFEDVNENIIESRKNVLDEKLNYLQLVDYNENLIRERLEDSNGLVDNSDVDQDEIMNDLKNLTDDINNEYNKLVGTNEENKNIENAFIEIIRNLLLTISKCNYSFVNVSKKLQNDLIEEIDKLLFDYLNQKSNYQQDSSKAAKDLIDVIETKCTTKKQYLYLSKIVENARKLLETLDEQLKHYDDHSQLKNELNDIRIKMDQLLNQLIYSKIKSETDVYTELLSLIQDNESYLNYDKIIERYENMNSKLILIQHSLDSKKL